MAKKQLYYIDNIRIFLTSLVILHHLAITYGGPGSWFYNELTATFPSDVLLSMFVATNQAFFMGMFFMISAYFMVPSLERKGAAQFLKDRFLRLGIPTVIYFFVLHPATVLVRNRWIENQDVTLVNYIFESKVWGPGPMWFVLALIMFSIMFVVLYKAEGKTELRKLPTPFQIVLLAIFIGIIQFIIRVWLPVGWSMPITGWQFPHFGQYVVFFVLGVISYQQEWFEQITPSMGWKWFWSMQVAIFAGFPLIFVLGGAMELGADRFMGGLYWQNLAYAIWEQVVGIGMVIALMGIFKQRWNAQGAVAKFFSRSAYATYVFHSVVLVTVSMWFVDLDLPSIPKFLVLSIPAVGLSYLVGALVSKIPILREIF